MAPSFIPDSMNGVHGSVAPAPCATKRPLAVIALALIACILTVTASVTVVWLRKGLEEVIVARSRDMPLVVVLKPNISDSVARTLADKLTNKIQGAEVVALGRDEARRLLSLQEPWFKEFQDLALVSLPCVIELRDAALLSAPHRAEQLLGEVQSYPEVDFAIFNSTGLDEAVRFIAAVRRHANVLVAVMLGVLFVLNAFLYGCMCWLFPIGHVPAGVLRALVVTVIAAPGGLLLWQGIMRLALRNVPTVATPNVVLMTLLLAWIACLYVAIEVAASSLFNAQTSVSKRERR